MYSIALSGPKRSRAKAELLLDEARVAIYPEGHHAVMDWKREFPGDKDEWLTVEHEDINHVQDVVAKAKGWRLRVHYPTPEAPKPNPLAATLAEMRAEIAQLKQKVRA